MSGVKKYKSGALRSPYDSRDYLIETLTGSTISKEGIPNMVDYRKVLKLAMNQGKQNTCSAFAAIGCKEWQENRDIKIRIDFSAQYIYNNRSNYPEEGMYGRDVMEILLKKGCCRESFYNYGLVETSTNISTRANEDAIKFKIRSYARVNTLDGLKKALYKYGPCYIAFPYYNNGADFWNPVGNQKMNGGHAVCIVGYNDNKKHFIIRNSWGYLWGDGGHTYFPYSDFGKQWEIWSIIDDKTPYLPPDPIINDLWCSCLVL